MKVTPVKKSFNQHKVGDVFEIPDKAAKVLIKLGKLREAIHTTAIAVETSPRADKPKRVYKRRDMVAES
jgi:hypothetical protein